jgi:hypothetical protein
MQPKRIELANFDYVVVVNGSARAYFSNTYKTSSMLRWNSKTMKNYYVSPSSVVCWKDNTHTKSSEGNPLEVI